MADEIKDESIEEQVTTEESSSEPELVPEVVEDEASEAEAPALEKTPEEEAAEAEMLEQLAAMQETEHEHHNDRSDGSHDHPQDHQHSNNRFVRTVSKIFHSHSHENNFQMKRL